MSTRPLYLIGEYRVQEGSLAGDSSAGDSPEGDFSEGGFSEGDPSEGDSVEGGPLVRGPSGGRERADGQTDGGHRGPADEGGVGLPSGPEGPIRIPEEAVPAFPEPSHDPGWILIADDVEPGLIMDLLVRLARSYDPWSPLLMRRRPPEGPAAVESTVTEGFEESGRGNGGEGTEVVELIPLSPGWPITPEDASDRIEEGGPAAGYLSFRLAMQDLSRVRHDINNPLTAALAEVQLSLLDVEPGSEFESSLRVVEDQIRRIRDLVKSLTRYRTPRP